ncbi:tetratricopeptide repeat protein 25-like [Cimex lectularius]|uniref:Outer dynein arm-docking complex subunit 4 n=1 Tax=Cimex lectularius TaxID=79782 RepID=A0A8I6THL3_CIMLE|nr:tetratricopeptide repeat protein 25-like [Cimex lectularius]
MIQVASRVTRDTEVMSSFLFMAEGGEDKDTKEQASHAHAPPPPKEPPITSGPAPPGGSHGVWQLSKELKLKSNKAKKMGRTRYEECYTDKDRAAAVNMGSRDIKQSLKMKRKQEKSKALQLPEETEPGALLALAGYEMTAKRTDIALSFINKALDLNPEDKQALVARSKCYLLLGEARKALQDAEAALSIDASFIKALFQKAEALYYLGNFEHSLMYFHRGLRLRPDMEGFRLGVQKAQEAIENIIGSRTTGLLASTEQITNMLKGYKTVEELYKTAVLDLGKPTTEITKGKSQNSIQGGLKLKKKNVGLKKAEKHLLGELYADKVYLEELLTKKLDVISINQDFANNDVALHAKEGIDFLTTRQDFWRQQKPKTSAPIKFKNGESKIR